ncbi:MAG TPA: S8 family serine peptidase, partial [Thermoanaerobaculia bacterium]|nr:S8 family serine peptidase [Thermoanaerobaculia bacterium]
QAPLDEAQTRPWGIDLVHAPQLWSATRGRGTVNVAIFDTGVDTTHPDVAPNVVGGYNTLTQQSDYADDNGHGTHVSGIVAALDNGFGVVGVAPEARVWMVKVLDANGNGTDENVIAGIDRVLAWKHAIGGQWIVSLSLGSTDPSDAEHAAFQRLADEDVLAVAAAGNRGLPALEYPAGYPEVLSVGALDVDQTLAGFSSYGPGIGVVAPGVKVLSTVPRGSFLTSGARVDGRSWLTGFPFTGAPHVEIHGTFVACGLGRTGDFPDAVRGKIALMQRGEITFAEKVRNAVGAGAVGAVIYNSDDSDPRDWTLYRPDCTDLSKGCVPWADDVAFPWPPTVAVTKVDGATLVAQSGGGVTIGTWLTDYKNLSGTSMATPHVSGIAALLWALAPRAHATDIRTAITNSAHDLGASGYDPQYGFGLIDAVAAAKLLAPSVIVSPPQQPPGQPQPPPQQPPPAPQPPRRRATH